MSQSTSIDPLHHSHPWQRWTRTCRTGSCRRPVHQRASKASGVRVSTNVGHLIELNLSKELKKHAFASSIITKVWNQKKWRGARDSYLGCQWQSQSGRLFWNIGHVLYPVPFTQKNAWAHQKLSCSSWRLGSRCQYLQWCFHDYDDHWSSSTTTLYLTTSVSSRRNKSDLRILNDSMILKSLKFCIPSLLLTCDLEKEKTPNYKHHCAQIRCVSDPAAMVWAWPPGRSSLSQRTTCRTWFLCRGWENKQPVKLVLFLCMGKQQLEAVDIFIYD